MGHLADLAFVLAEVRSSVGRADMVSSTTASRKFKPRCGLTTKVFHSRDVAARAASPANRR